MLPFTEQAKFARLSRLLKGYGYKLRQCPQDSLHFAERGRYYVVADDGEIATNVDLIYWLKELGKPNVQRFDVTLMFALNTPEMREFIQPVEGKIGYYAFTTSRRPRRRPPLTTRHGSLCRCWFAGNFGPRGRS